MAQMISSSSSLTSLSPTTIWYFYDDKAASWNAFDDSECILIENCFLSGNYMIDIKNDRFDFRQMFKSNILNGEMARIKRENNDIKPGSCYWEWRDNGFWVPFSAVDSDTISRVAGHKNCVTLYVGPTLTAYEINTASLRQLNLHSGYKRKIQQSLPIVNASNNNSQT